MTSDGIPGHSIKQCGGGSGEGGSRGGGKTGDGWYLCITMDYFVFVDIEFW